jgi:prolyl oligopeptidase
MAIYLHSRRRLPTRLSNASLTVLPSLIFICFICLATRASNHPKPPATRIDNIKETLHGVDVVDPYRWLEDQESKETREWIDDQNRYTQSILSALPGRDKLTQRLTELLKIEAVDMPVERGGRYFYSKRRADQDLSVLYVRNGRTGAEEVLVDPHPMSADKTVSVSLSDVSLDGTLMGFSVRRGGEDEAEIRWLNVETRQELPDTLPRARYFGVAVKPDKSGFYYSRHGKEGSRIFYHRMGTDFPSDTELFGKGYSADKGIGIDLSEDGHYLLMTVFYGSAAEKTELHLLDTHQGTTITPIVTDIQARFYGQIAGDQLFVQTNWNAANSKVLKVDLKNRAREHWREIVPETAATIEGVSLAGGNVFVNYLRDVRSSVKVFSGEGKPLRDIVFPSLGTVGSVYGRWNSSEAFFQFTSFHIPTTIYRYEVADGKQEVWSRLNVPIRSEAIDVKQVWYESKDRTRIPMFLVHRKGLKLDGTHPTLLTGYGGFTQSLTPKFNARAALWVERGGVFAVPNLRGGGEFGEKWHKAGMLDKKQNVFDDFIAAAEWLVKNRYTRPSRLAISGGSNGGLLVGAALTQRPELFQAVVCSYPLLDMVRYDKFLIARFWVPEYGSADDPHQFKFIHAYSPYHHVTPGTKYPAVLLITGDSDTRVAPLHARKMAALLQSATGSDRPVLLHYDTKAGHVGGTTPVSKRIEELTDEVSFLDSQLESEDSRNPRPSKSY